MKKSQASYDLKLIHKALERASEHGLEPEVMWTAIKSYEKFHKTAPETYNLEWALEVALNEWDI